MVTKKIERSDGKSALIKDDDSWNSWTFHHLYNVFRSLFLFFAFVNHSLEEYFFCKSLSFCSRANLCFLFLCKPWKNAEIKGGNCKLDIFSTRHFTEFETHKKCLIKFLRRRKTPKKFSNANFPIICIFAPKIHCCTLEPVFLVLLKNETFSIIFNVCAILQRNKIS